MSDHDQILAVKILDRSYKVKCSPEQAAELEQAAHYLNDQMKKVRQSANVTSTDRIAIVTALNVAHELLQLKKQSNGYIDIMNQRIKHLQDKIHQALEEKQAVEV